MSEYYIAADKIMAQNGKEIKHVIDAQGNFVYKSKNYYTWSGIRSVVRSGLAQTYYPVGSIIYDNFDSSTGTAFQVVGYDKHFDPALTAQGYTHSMTLCQLKLDLRAFDNTEAFLYLEQELPAGTYRFTIPNYDASYGGNKTYYFTSTGAVPVGGQIVMNWPYNQTPKTVSAYTSQTSTTAITGFSALTLTEWVDGTSPQATDIGTIAGPTSQTGSSTYGKMNHIHRARYGSNNYYQSGLRQWMNASGTGGTWWEPQTIFDRPYGNRTNDGYLSTLNPDMVGMLGTPTIESLANSYFETASLDGTTFTTSQKYTISTDKMFALSPVEVGFSTTDTSVGTLMNYYANATNDTRIKNRKDTGAAYYWWLRTPNPSYAYYVRYVDSSGALSYSTARNTYGVAPACIIQ